METRQDPVDPEVWLASSENLRQRHAVLANDLVSGAMILQLNKTRKIGEIAERLNLSERTVKRRLAFAKLLLQPGLGDLRNEFMAGRISRVDAERTARRRLNLPVRDRRQQTLTQLRQAELEGFVGGLRWAHEALNGERAPGVWPERQLEEWRAGKGW